MTFSIVARSDDGREWGVAVATKFLAVGAGVPAAEAGVGALATQADTNTLYKRDGLARLRAGHTAAAAVDALLAADDRREHRQLGIVDADGRSATYTGANCHDWAGGTHGDGFAIQGNLLAGSRVVDVMRSAWLAGQGTPFPDRLVAALAAGDEAGGDRRGRQSAALLVVSEAGTDTPGDDVACDLRVDDHADPCGELSRLLALHHLYFDCPDEADLVTVEGQLANDVKAQLAVLGYDDLPTWIRFENYELRMVEDRVDRAVLDQLRKAAERRRSGPTP